MKLCVKDGASTLARVRVRVCSLQIVCAALALGVPMAAGADCSFKTSTPSELQKIIDDNGGYPISDEQCSKLNQGGLRLSVNGEAAVINGISVGWASVTVEDAKTAVVSSHYAKGTAVNSNKASTEESERLFYQALKIALPRLDVGKALLTIRNP